MVPVFFGFMGFAIDLGRLYLIRGELNQAANAMALAAASKLNGTEAATDYADTAALLTLNDTNGNGNRYNFSGVTLNEGTTFLSSNAPAPTYYATATDAIAAIGNSAAGGTADGTTAQYAQAYITADAPLTFWALLAGGQSRKTTVAAAAVAGISAPLCTACDVDVFAIAALDQTDLVNFGYTTATNYTFGYVCNGGPTPAPLPGDSARIPYLLINRYDTTSAYDETQQLFRTGAQGIPPSTDPTQACITVNNTELLWASATPGACGAATPNTSVEELLCGLTTRLDSNAITTYTACSEVTNLDVLAAAYEADTDVAAYTDYTQYTGDNRRIITAAVVDTLSATAAMTILGFRQFLLEPTSGDTSNVPTDGDGRFSTLYIGNPVPLKQGRFDGGCGLTSGPGKVVLFQ